MQEKLLSHRRLYQQTWTEWLTASGLFPMFDAVREISVNGFTLHAISVTEIVLFAASAIQALVISSSAKSRWWHYFIAPLIYTFIDGVMTEGLDAFWSEPYHNLYWLWSAIIVVASSIQQRAPSLGVILKSVSAVLLLPLTYMLAEWSNARLDPIGYWLYEPSHLFILLGTIVLGIALGITSVMREHFERLLADFTEYFKQIASWSFDVDLMQAAYSNHATLTLQRRERTVLFMDIRGFTPWSEAHQPQEVVDMVSQFYRASEAIIKKHNGFKIQITGDEIMTRFCSADEAVAAAQELQTAIPKLLGSFGLSVGIGLHSGEVIEGLVGSEQTRQYGIFGDTVNTAARLQAQAKTGEVVISQATWERLTRLPRNYHRCTMSLKGKSEAVPVVILSHHPMPNP